MIARRIVLGFLLILALLVLELNRNTVAGWIITAALFIAVEVLYETGLLRKHLLLRIGGWVFLLAGFAVILFLTWPPVRRVPVTTDKSARETGVVQLRDGKVSGLTVCGGQVEVYAAIPYAAPPVGSLRWKPPVDPEPWEGIRKTADFAPMSMQVVKSPIMQSLTQLVGYHNYKWFDFSDSFTPAASEDSLYVNVWKPAGEQKDLPVLVFVHGGSLQTGDPSFEDYSGEGLAKQGVIVVNMGYRLGAFGFFAHEDLLKESPGQTTGNYGLLDQIKALEWVKNNISSFGGNPSNVTLAGESAGSASVSALCTSPLAKGLFRRVILESSTVASASPPHSFRALEDALASGEELMLACGAKSVEELRALPAEKIAPFMETEHHITVDGCVLTELPYESYRKGVHNEEAILHGYNSRESGPFLLFSNASAKDFVSRVRNALKTEADAVLEAYPHATDAEAKESWAEIYGAIFFDYPHYCLNRLANANGIPVYYYLFDKQNKRIGSWHGGEMIYVYGNLDKDADLFDESDFALSRSLSGSWRSFAETGDPGKTSGVAWTQAADPLSQTGFGETVSPVRESGRKQVLYDALDRLQNFTTEPINGKEGVSGAGN